MVIDSSAILAILFREPERETFLLKLSHTDTKLVSAPTLVEISLVAKARKSFVEVDELLGHLRVEIVPFDVTQAHLAREAFERFGKGNDKAGLNFGDCMTYALAKQTSEPLLFKGNDFSKTDILPA